MPKIEKEFNIIIGNDKWFPTSRELKRLAVCIKDALEPVSPGYKHVIKVSPFKTGSQN